MGRSSLVLSLALVAALSLLSVPARAGMPLWLESRGGATFSQFLEDPGAKQKTGFAGSIAFHLGLNDWLTFQPELGYVMKGTSYGTEVDPVIGEDVYPGTFEILYAADYIEAPLLMRARLRGGMVRPHLVAGPVIGWKVVEKFRLLGTDDLSGEGIAMRPFDLAVAGGLAFEFGPADRCLTLEARYTRGMVDALKDEYIGTVKNQDLRVTLGWKSTWAPGLGLR